MTTRIFLLGFLLGISITVGTAYIAYPAIAYHIVTHEWNKFQQTHPGAHFDDQA